jgi:hypothetical protein
MKTQMYTHALTIHTIQTIHPTHPLYFLLRDPFYILPIFLLYVTLAALAPPASRKMMALMPTA